MDDQSRPTWLSPSGESRRREILRLALTAARQRRRRRRAVALGCAAVIASGLGGLGISTRIHRQTAHQVVIVHSTPSPAPSPAPSSDKVPIVYIQTDPDIVKRLAVPARPPSWQMLTDAQLLQTLAAEGKPVGLVNVDGREILWTGP
jgi:hypothetical protein